jgi:hypothetical protein
MRRIGIATPVAATPQPVANPATPSPGEENSVLKVNELMLSSLPPMASGADVYVRQFYRGNQKLPFRRYLPLRGKDL